MKLLLEKPKRKKRKKKKWTKQRIRRCWINACLDLWSILIRHRDKKCVWCGSVNRLQAHHIVSKALLGGNLAGYLDLSNGMALCFKCHIRRLKADVDGYIEMRDNFLENVIGVEYDELRLWCTAKTKYSKDDLANLYEWDLKVRVSELKIYDEQIEKIEKRWLSKIPQ